MQTRGPWRIKSVETRYENPWIKLEHHEVVTPASTDGIYGVIHYKNYAIGVIPLDEHGNTWIVGQYRYPLERYSWELPEGGGLEGSEPLDGAKRELLEEVGLAAERWDLILEMDLSNSVSDERAYIYVARNLTQLTAHPEETEELEVKKVPFAELFEQVMRGDHRDSLTVAGVLKCKLLMDRGEI
jgi:ADP-ribose pyrophosphatase